MKKKVNTFYLQLISSFGNTKLISFSHLRFHINFPRQIFIDRNTIIIWHYNIQREPELFSNDKNTVYFRVQASQKEILLHDKKILDQKIVEQKWNPSHPFFFFPFFLNFFPSYSSIDFQIHKNPQKKIENLIYESFK